MPPLSSGREENRYELNQTIYEAFQSIGPLGQCFLQVDLSICLCVCVYVFSVCLSVHFLRYRSNVFLPPISQTQMSKIFRDLESLGKSNGKKCFQIWKPLRIKGVKSLHKKCFFFCEFCLTEQNFFGMGVSYSV